MKALFVCVQNAGRSQMAHAFAEAAGIEARSAGTRPAARVHDVVAAVMKEVGIDVAERVPQRLTEEDAEWADVVVTMGCGDECPYIPGKRYVDWELADPALLEIDDVRAVRDDIQRRVSELAASASRAPAR